MPSFQNEKNFFEVEDVTKGLTNIYLESDISLKNVGDRRGRWHVDGFAFRGS